MKTSQSTYCGECLKDFVDQEIVWFAWIENRSFCGNCKPMLDIKDWEKRIIKGHEKRPATTQVHD